MSKKRAPVKLRVGTATRKLRFVCDGPPSHESGRFVELEDENGHGVGGYRWRKRPDDLWELVVPLAAPALLEALKFCRSVLAANPVEMSERMAIGKADAAIDQAWGKS
jgi:hypothetical protein